MRINFIPENILKARTDCKLLFRDPYRAAIYNFKMSINASHIKEHTKFGEVAKVEDVAKPAIDGTQRTPKTSCGNLIIHFLAHVGIGIVLFIPLLNFIPFVILTLKAKEHKEPSSADVTSQIQNPSQNTPIPIPLHPKTPSSSKPRPKFNFAMTSPQSPTKTAISQINCVNPEVDVLERNVAKLYYSLFPEEIPQEIKFSLSTDDHWNDVMPVLVKAIGRIILISEGTSPKPSEKSQKKNSMSVDRLNKAWTNLTIVREFLDEKFKNHGKDHPIKSVYSKDFQKSPSSNPYVFFRLAVCQKSTEALENMLPLLDFKIEKNVITLNPDQSIEEFKS